jgi:hypothetical protein
MYCLVALLAVVAVFIESTVPSMMLASCSLGLTLSLGYLQINRIQLVNDEIQTKIYEGAINMSLAIGVLISTVNHYIHFSIMSAKLMVLVATLANFYLPVSEYYSENKIKEKKINSKLAFTFSPFYLKEWTYSIGYAIGIYLNTFKILAPNKYGKYLVVGLLLLIEMLTYKMEIKLIS